MESRELVANDSELPVRGASSIVDEFEHYEVSQHVLFTSMHDRPVDYTALWLLMANLQCSISGHFVRWLAHVISRVEDHRIASLLAKQLNDELGNGDLKGIHSLLLERFVTGLEPWRPASADRDLLVPGLRLLSTMNGVFTANDPYEAVGALMVSEIFAKKMDKCVGDQVRRQELLSADSLTWLTLHECLEVAHADDARELAELVPAQGHQLRAAWRGARAEWGALWGFLDDVHAVVVALQLASPGTNTSTGAGTGTTGRGRR